MAATLEPELPTPVIEILQALRQHGYTLAEIPANGDTLMEQLHGITNEPDSWQLRPAWQSLAADTSSTLPACRRPTSKRCCSAGTRRADPMLRNGRFMLAGLRLGNIFVGIQPARGYHLDALASYHDPDLVPPHYYLAFYH